MAISAAPPPTPPLTCGIEANVIAKDFGYMKIEFNASIDGGVAPYTYEWYIDDSAAPFAFSQLIVVEFKGCATRKVELIVRDSNHPGGECAEKLTIEPPCIRWWKELY